MGDDQAGQTAARVHPRHHLTAGRLQAALQAGLKPPLAVDVTKLLEERPDKSPSDMPHLYPPSSPAPSPLGAVSAPPGRSRVTATAANHGCEQSSPSAPT